MASKLSLYDLYEIKKKKDNKLNEAFNIILNACHKKIKNIAEIGGQSLYYTIPPIIIGYPLYNYSTCMNYIISELKKMAYMSLFYLNLIIIIFIFLGNLKMYLNNHLRNVFYFSNFKLFHIITNVLKSL